MAWKFETSGLDGQCKLFGVNIFKYRWRDCRERAAVTDPHYGVEKAFHVYEVEIDGQLRRFAAGEQKLKRAKIEIFKVGLTMKVYFIISAFSVNSPVS